MIHLSCILDPCTETPPFISPPGYRSTPELYYVIQFLRRFISSGLISGILRYLIIDQLSAALQYAFPAFWINIFFLSNLNNIIKNDSISGKKVEGGGGNCPLSPLKIGTEISRYFVNGELDFISNNAWKMDLVSCH